MKNILLIMPYGSVGGMERLALTFYDLALQKSDYSQPCSYRILLPPDFRNSL